MLRKLAVLLSALVAVSVLAQDASTPEPQEKPAAAAPAASPAEPAAEVDAGAPEEPDDCGLHQWARETDDEKEPPFGLRSYEPAPPSLDRRQKKAWIVPPGITRAGRCLSRYYLLVRSESKEPWVIKEAKLVGADGKVLKVIEIDPKQVPPNVSLNVITAVRTEGATGANYVLRTIELKGKDGRDIVLRDLELP